MPLEVPAAGALSFDLDAAYANTFSHTWHARAIHTEEGIAQGPFTREEAELLHSRHGGDRIAFLDAEVTRVSLRVSAGLGGGASAALEVPWISFSALHLDSELDRFHRLFGLTAAQRTDFPRSVFEVVQQRPGGPLEFENQTPGAGLGDAVASARWVGAAGPRATLGALFALKIPTGDANSWRGSGSLDAGLLLASRLELGGRFAARLETGAVVPGRFRGRGPATFHPTWFLRLLGALEWRAGARRTVSLAGVLEQSPERADARGDAGRTSYEVTLGFTRRLGEHAGVSLCFVENLPWYGDAADFAARLSVRVFP